MNNIASIFIIQESYLDIILLMHKLLTKPSQNEQDLSILYLCYEILANFSKVTVKGTAQIFGETIKTKEDPAREFRFIDLAILTLQSSDHSTPRPLS